MSRRQATVLWQARLVVGGSGLLVTGLELEGVAEGASEPGPVEFENLDVACGQDEVIAIPGLAVACGKDVLGAVADDPVSAPAFATGKTARGFSAGLEKGGVEGGEAV